MVHRLRVNVAAVEEIAHDEQEIHTVRDRRVGDDIIPGAKEVFGAFFQIIAAAAEVYISQVKKSHCRDIIRYSARIGRPMKGLNQC